MSFHALPFAVEQLKTVALFVVAAFLVGRFIDLVWIHVVRPLDLIMPLKIMMMAYLSHMCIELVMFIDKQTPLHTQDKKNKKLNAQKEESVPLMVPIAHFTWLLVMFHTSFTEDVLRFVTHQVHGSVTQ